MCGDLESDETLAEEFYTRFVDDTHSFLTGLSAETIRGEDENLYVHLDSLFRSTLTGATEPSKAPTEVSGYDRLSMEPLVYARLAGFMAAHLPLEEDPMRRLLDAIMTGYAEGEEIILERDHAHLQDHAH